MSKCPRCEGTGTIETRTAITRADLTETILSSTAEYYGMERRTMMESRKESAVVARQIATWLLANEMAWLTHKEIAKLIGRERSTATYSINKIEDWLRIGSAPTLLDVASIQSMIRRAATRIASMPPARRDDLAYCRAELETNRVERLRDILAENHAHVA